LGVPKSRISRRVAVLEEQLGVRLLERSTRQLNVTEVGQDVYRHARAAMVEAEAVDEVAARMRSEPQGLIRLSCPLGLQRTVSHALPAFLSEYPRLRIQLLITNRPVDLIEEAVDIAIRIRERLDTDADLVVKRIGTSRRILVASDSLLQQYRRRMTSHGYRHCIQPNDRGLRVGRYRALTDVRARSISSRDCQPEISPSCSTGPFMASAWRFCRKLTAVIPLQASSSNGCFLSGAWRTAFCTWFSLPAAGCFRGYGRSSTSSRRRSNLKIPRKFFLVTQPRPHSADKIRSPSRVCMDGVS
jgi:DNA-binding transcriptional LysR family regulator